MSYSNPDVGVYHFPLMDFGVAVGDTVHRISGPNGKQGKLREVGVCTAEAFACDNNVAKVMVGTADDKDAYGQLEIADGTAINTTFNSGDDANAILNADIPADTCVLVTLEEGTDTGTVTGQGNPYVIIDWI